MNTHDKPIHRAKRQHRGREPRPVRPHVSDDREGGSHPANRRMTGFATSRLNRANPLGNGALHHLDECAWWLE